MSPRLVLDAMLLSWRASRSLTTAYAVLTLVAGAVPVSAAWMTKLVLDSLTGPASDAYALVPLVAGLILAGAAVAVVPHGQRYLQAELGRRVKTVAQGTLMRATGSLRGLARFESPEFQDRLQLALQAGQFGANDVIASGLATVQGAVSVTGFVVTLWTLNPWMVLVVAVIALPTLRSELRLSRRRTSVMLTVSEATRREFFYAQLLTDVRAAKEIRLFDLGGFFAGRMLSELRRVHGQERRLDRRQLAMQAAYGLGGAAVVGGGLVWAVYAARAGSLTVGDVSVFVAAVAGVQAALNGILRGLGQGYQSLLLFGHYQAVVSAPPDLPQASSPARTPALRTGIELRDVWFRYADDLPWILQGVNLTIAAGTSTAVVGRNGAGKSTIVKLLCRLYDPTRGAVLWDGVDLRELDIAALRERCAVLFQDFMAYDLTAAENIAVGDLSHVDDPSAIEAAAFRAGAHETLTGLPDGYRTMLTRTYFGEQDREDPATGVVLSGGQWQRVALARTILRQRRDLLILDEPSSGLDAQAEAQVHRQITAYRRGGTSVLVSHRLGAVRAADTIVVLSDGRVVEQGPHRQLVDDGGLYADLFSLQAEGYVNA